MTQQTNHMRFLNTDGNTTDAHCRKIFNESELANNIPCLDDTGRWKQRFSDVEIAHQYRTYDFGLEESNNTMCVCNTYRGFFHVGVEEIILYIDHFYHSKILSGALTKTYIRTYGNDENKAVLESGAGLALSLKEMLEYAEVELDKRCDEGLNKQWLADNSEAQERALQGPGGSADNVYPYVRVTGLRLDVTMEYYNYRLAPGIVDKNDRSELWDIDNSDAATVCVMILRPYLAWTSQGNSYSFNGRDFVHPLDVATDDYRYGALVTFQSGGVIGGFDSFMLFTAITQVIVALGVAAQITTIVARSCLGEKSTLYKSVMSERFSALGIYSRFAAQAITASIIFDMVDENSSGRVSKRELYKPLRRLYHKQMDEQQIGTLVEFVTYMANIQDVPNKVVNTCDKEADGTTSSKSHETVDVLEEPEEALDAVSSTDNNVVTIEGDDQNIEMQNVRRTNSRISSRGSSRQSFMDTVNSAKPRQQKRQLRRHHISRPQWASVFAGPPCNIKACIGLIDRKGAQGHFTPEDNDMQYYQEMEQLLTMEMRAEETIVSSGEVVGGRLRSAVPAISNDMQSQAAENCRINKIPSLGISENSDEGISSPAAPKMIGATGATPSTSTHDAAAISAESHRQRTAADIFRSAHLGPCLPHLPPAEQTDWGMQGHGNTPAVGNHGTPMHMGGFERVSRNNSQQALVSHTVVLPREILERMVEDMFELKQQVAVLRGQPTNEGAPRNEQKDIHDDELRPPGKQISHTSTGASSVSRQTSNLSRQSSSVGRNTSSEWWSSNWAGNFQSSLFSPLYGGNSKGKRPADEELEVAPKGRKHYWGRNYAARSIEDKTESKDPTQMATHNNPTFAEEKELDL
ncbi:hypothetical protein CYMTET_25071 [Cymbomonas tetramitiformis]|uniref:EF-hand domain-containing protein n=1 Tax=Cymbomonas tetramitiformis TaxID=36881 RepID=A0AAE0FV54_9CHLO|nr:hypothetical protein CYMTET_25071 [Cymbomonas tetramitiformis]